MISKVVLYLQYLGLLEPSGWVGDLLLVIYFPLECSDLNRWKEKNLIGHGNSRGVATPLGRTLRHLAVWHGCCLVPQCHTDRRTSGHCRWFSQWSHKRFWGTQAICFCASHYDECFVLTRKRLYLFLFKAEHRRYIFPIQNKFFLIKSIAHANIFLSLTPCPLVPNYNWPCRHNSTKSPLLETSGIFALHRRKVQKPFDFCFQLLIWMFGVVQTHPQVNRCLAKTPVCFLSQWGWGERFARVCLPLELKNQTNKKPEGAMEWIHRK